MDLAGVMARVRDVNPYYVDMLTWKQQGRFITATPKKPLSDLSFSAVKRVFRRLGGKYVSSRGQSWFELVLEESGPRDAVNPAYLDPQGMDSARLSPLSGPALTQIEAKIASLRRAGQELLQEA